jgi:hypothetical protein
MDQEKALLPKQAVINILTHLELQINGREGAWMT